MFKCIAVILGATGFSWLMGLVILLLWVWAAMRELRRGGRLTR
jgi:hypothetical protein